MPSASTAPPTRARPSTPRACSRARRRRHAVVPLRGRPLRGRRRRLLAVDGAGHVRRLGRRSGRAGGRHDPDRCLLVSRPHHAVIGRHPSSARNPMTPLRITSRNLLRGGLAAPAAIPWLEARQAQGQTATPPTRLVVFTQPNGTRNALFWPTGTETNFKMNTFTADLEPYKSKLTFLKGITLNPALQPGMLGGTVGSEHARGTGGMLTG